MAGKSDIQLRVTGDPPVMDVNEEEELEKTNKDCTLRKTTWYTLNFACHVLIALATIFLVYLSSKNWTITDIHVALCTVGYVLLMAEAISVLSKDNIWSIWFSRRTVRHIHWILQVVGMICSFAGVGVIYVKRNRHFFTIHAIVGLSSMVVMVVSMILGLLVMYVARLRNIVRPVVVKFAHNFLGISCYVLGMVAQCYGYQKTWMSWALNYKGNMETTCLVATAFITLLSLRGALGSLYYQGRRLFR